MLLKGNCKLTCFRERMNECGFAYAALPYNSYDFAHGLVNCKQYTGRLYDVLL